MRPWRPPELHDGTPTLGLEFVGCRLGKKVLVEGSRIAPANHPNAAASLEVLFVSSVVGFTDLRALLTHVPSTANTCHIPLMQQWWICKAFALERTLEDERSCVVACEVAGRKVQPTDSELHGPTHGDRDADRDFRISR